MSRAARPFMPQTVAKQKPNGTVPLQHGMAWQSSRATRCTASTTPQRDHDGECHRTMQQCPIMCRPRTPLTLAPAQKLGACTYCRRAAALHSTRAVDHEASCDVEALQPQARLVRLNLNLAVDFPLFDHTCVAHLLRICSTRQEKVSEAWKSLGGRTILPLRACIDSLMTHQGMSSRSSCHFSPAWGLGRLLQTTQLQLAQVCRMRTGLTTAEAGSNNKEVHMI